MKFSELIDELARRNDMDRKQARAVLDSLSDILGEELERGGEVYLGPAIGRYRVKTYPPAQRRSPLDGKLLQLPVRARVRFKPGKYLVDRVTRGMMVEDS